MKDSCGPKGMVVISLDKIVLGMYICSQPCLVKVLQVVTKGQGAHFALDQTMGTKGTLEAQTLSTLRQRWRPSENTDEDESWLYHGHSLQHICSFSHLYIYIVRRFILWQKVKEFIRVTNRSYSCSLKMVKTHYLPRTKSSVDF